MGRETYKSSPFLLKIGWGLTKTLMYKFPGFPPFFPASPFPSTNICWFVSTPAGMKILMFSSPLILPSPLQTLQIFVGLWPSPLHSGQTTNLVKEPKKVLLICWTSPFPRQEKHSSILVPGSAPIPTQRKQVIYFSKTSSCSFPFKTSSKEITSSTSISFPFLKFLLRLLWPNPKTSSIISPKSPTSKSKSLSLPMPGRPQNHWWSKPPVSPVPGTPSKTWPNLSYWAFFSLLERIW